MKDRKIFAVIYFINDPNFLCPRSVLNNSNVVSNSSFDQRQKSHDYKNKRDNWYEEIGKEILYKYFFKEKNWKNDLKIR